MLKTLISILLALVLTSANADNQLTNEEPVAEAMQLRTAQIEMLSYKSGFDEPESNVLSKQDIAIKIRASAISVSSMKITWNAIGDHRYSISCVKAGKDSTNYAQNIRIKRTAVDSCYVTGLREGTMYILKIEDLTADLFDETIAQTEKTKSIEKYNYVSGWTNCFAYESASGLTCNPSKAAIAGAVSDPVTNTGIMRNEYGDYCVAMGLHYGECGDRFLVELENGTQFTVMICDSKGYASDGQGIYHTFGFSQEGKCIIEFIHGAYLPSDISQSGNYGSRNWDGLIFDNIKSITRIEYGNTIEY